MGTLPCWLCGKQLDVRVTKNGKLYFICDPDGLQVFVRRATGMERLKQLIRHMEIRKLVFEQQAETVCEIQAMLRELNALKEEIAKVFV